VDWCFVKQFQVLLKASSELFISAPVPLRSFHLRTRCSENYRNPYRGFTSQGTLLSLGVGEGWVGRRGRAGKAQLRGEQMTRAKGERNGALEVVASSHLRLDAGALSPSKSYPFHHQDSPNNHFLSPRNPFV